MITRCGALELGSRGIRVVGIAPGLVETPLTRKELEDPAMRELFLGVIPMKRAVEAQEIAAAAVFLASDHGRSINGETIAIDGGSLTRGYPALLTGLKRHHDRSASLYERPNRRRQSFGSRSIAWSFVVPNVRPSKTWSRCRRCCFVRGDLLGRIADHDRAELVATEAIAVVARHRERALYPRAARGAFPSVRAKHTRFSIERSRPDIQGKRSMPKRRRCCRRPGQYQRGAGSA